MFLLNSFFFFFSVCFGLSFWRLSSSFIYLLLAVLGLCCVWAFIVVAHRLRFCMWNLPWPGTELVSPALAGRFLSIVLPGKSWMLSSNVTAHSYLIRQTKIRMGSSLWMMGLSLSFTVGISEGQSTFSQWYQACSNNNFNSFHCINSFI